LLLWIARRYTVGAAMVVRMGAGNADVPDAVTLIAQMIKNAAVGGCLLALALRSPAGGSTLAPALAPAVRSYDLRARCVADLRVG
jgi:hypothetical protein